MNKIGLSFSSREVVRKASDPPAHQMVVLHRRSSNLRKEDKEGMKRRTRSVGGSDWSGESEGTKLAKLISSVLRNAGLEVSTVGEGRKRCDYQIVPSMLR